ncbi:MAG: D-alanyl-D-alanine carboxypeptidase [Clostridia bacterium]|nr:D-alanyl-D-alanine carboxypeptidase [Clostridia bacterium]
MKRFISCFLLIFIMLNQFTVLATQKNIDAISAPTYLLMDGINDAVMYEEGCNTNLAINNFAKIMTAILSIEKFAPNDILTFTDETNVFYGNGFGNIAYTKPGLTYTVKNHLENMLLLFSDASAIALAKAHSGSEEAFVSAMNNRAKELLMNDTLFVSSDGHDTVTSQGKTTVYDLYKLMKHAMSLPLFQQIMKEVTIELPNTSGGVTPYTSRNHLISKFTYSSFVYSPAVAGFISYNQDSSSFIAVCEKSGNTIYSLVMNTPDNATQVYKDIINLSEHGYNSYSSVILAKKGSFLHQVPLKFASSSDAVLVLKSDISAQLPLNYDEADITYKTTSPKSVTAPIKQGEDLGSITYYYKDNKLATGILVAEKDISFSLFGWLFRLFSKVNGWLLLLILASGLLVVNLVTKKARKKEELKRRKREILDNNDK